MAVEFWLNNGADKVRFPVNPESNSYTNPHNYVDTEVEGLGEVTTIGHRGLREYTIQSFWPAKYNPVYCSYSSFTTPQKFVERIQYWQGMRKPIRLVVTGAGAVNIAVTIREFSVEAEKAGSPGDVYFTLVLKQYREHNVKRLDTSKKQPVAATQRPPAAKPTQAKTYTVKPNDSLWKIAARKEIYGNGSKWRKIYDANTKIIGKNPNNLKAGQKLVIPQ